MVQNFKEYHIHILMSTVPHKLCFNNKEGDLRIKYLCIQVVEVTCIENIDMKSMSMSDETVLMSTVPHRWCYGYLDLKSCSMMGSVSHETHVVLSRLLSYKIYKL